MDEQVNLLTEDERHVMDLSAQLWNALTRVISDGPSREQDVDELAAHIHVIQRTVMAQAAARAYPDKYRLLGGVVQHDATATFPEVAKTVMKAAGVTIPEVLPPMWVVWLDDPSGKYGDHKAFFAHGLTAYDAEQVAMKARPGSSIKHPTTRADRFGANQKDEPAKRGPGESGVQGKGSMY